MVKGFFKGKENWCCCRDFLSLREQVPTLRKDTTFCICNNSKQQFNL